MKKAKSDQGGGKRQVDAFRKAARELGCEGNEGKFQEALRRVASHKPAVEKKAKKPTR